MTTADMIGKKWIHPTTGEIRYYVNNAWEYGGLELWYYNTGNISCAELNGERISNAEGRRLSGSIYKVYITEDNAVHVQHDGYDGFARAIVKGLEAKLKEE